LGNDADIFSCRDFFVARRFPACCGGHIGPTGGTQYESDEKIFHQTPQQIRQELQQGKSGDLTRRRLIIVLSLVGLAAMTMVSLFQTGLIHHIPDLPNRALFDSAKVNSSEQAYKFGLPDGPFVMVSLAITIVLAAFGGANRAEVHLWIPLVFTAKTAVDAFFSAAYLWNMITVQKVACIYCIAAALATFAIVALTLPETKRAMIYVKLNHRAPVQTHA
jgi:uncharacterized membrane protein